jgi:hypothetical protein
MFFAPEALLKIRQGVEEVGGAILQWGFAAEGIAVVRWSRCTS